LYFSVLLMIEYAVKENGAPLGAEKDPD